MIEDENPYSMKNLEKSNFQKEWTFGGVLLGLFIATVFWSVIFLVGPRYVILNDGTIIETVMRGMKWVEVGRDK